MAAETMTMAPVQHPLMPMFGIEGDQAADLVAELPKFEESSIKRVCKLGRGAHSNVYLVATPSRQQLALKCLDSKSIRSKELHSTLTSDLVSEAYLLAGLDHENIIKIRGISCTPLGNCDAAGSQSFFFLMDVLSDSLMDRVRRWSKDPSNYKKGSSSALKKRCKLDPKKMIGRMETTAIGVAKGMAYLHNKGIVVQDLKPANIGFDMETGQTRIFDFGMARHVLDLSINKTKVEICGTPRYMAPEIMKGETATKASDVYSFGCVLYTLCTLKVPFRKFEAKEDGLKEFKALVVSGQRPPLGSIRSLELRSLIEDCWAQDPLDRPTFEEIVEQRLPAITVSSTEKRKSTKRSISRDSLGGSMRLPSMKRRSSLSGDSLGGSMRLSGDSLGGSMRLSSMKRRSSLSGDSLGGSMRLSSMKRRSSLDDSSISSIHLPSRNDSDNKQKTSTGRRGSLGGSMRLPSMKRRSSLGDSSSVSIHLPSRNDSDTKQKTRIGRRGSLGGSVRLPSMKRRSSISDDSLSSSIHLPSRNGSDNKQKNRMKRKSSRPSWSESMNSSFQSMNSSFHSLHSSFQSESGFSISRAG